MSSKPLLRPPAVKPGAAVCVIAPASSAQQDRIDRGLTALQSLGFHPSLGTNALVRGPLYFSGNPQQRLADLYAAFADPTTSIAMATRGGYGSNYLLEGIDLGKIKERPKPFFAYSDLTAVQLHLLDKLGLPAFHGPMVAADFYLEDGVHFESFNATISGRPYSLGAGEGLRTLKPGTACGTLYGGCLGIIVALLGTPWEPETEGKLLFLEDVGTKPYQVDRMLWQMRTAGKLEGVTGIVFGEMVNCVSPGAPPELLEQAILSALDGFDGPIAIGLRSGHVSRQNVTLTFGVESELDLTSEPALRLLEPALMAEN